MPLIFINGISGSGKSTVQKELAKLGYVAYDADDPSFGAPHNKQTNQIVKMLPLEQRTAGQTRLCKITACLSSLANIG